MATNAANHGGRRGRFWRIAGWTTAVLVLLVPLAAMQFTSEVEWDETDFITFGAMLASASGAYELGARTSGSGAYRAAVGIAVAAAFLLVWINLAVGIIGSEDNPANLMFGGVIGVALLGAAIGRFRPEGMARAMAAAAIAQALAGAISLSARLGSDGPVLALSAFFAGLWLLSAALFRVAARQQGERPRISSL